MDALTNLVAFVFVLGVIIFFHELGHLVTAKAFGMRVFIFSFGFGKRLFGFQWGDTDCRVSLVPLGGYVKLEGEPEDHLSEDTSGRGDARDFTSRPRWQRFLVYLAGPFMNGVLTIAVFTILFMMGSRVDATLYDRAIVGSVEAGSPADAAGLVPGDEIVAVDGTPVSTWEEAGLAIMLRPQRALTVRVRRGGEVRELSLQSRVDAASKTGDIGVKPVVRVGELTDGPAREAGLRPDDALLRVNGQPVRSFEHLVDVVRASGGQPLTFEVLREGRILEVAVTPREGRIGVARKTVERKYPLAGALGAAFRETGERAVQTLALLKDVITGSVSPRAALAGPVGIAQASGEAARSGSAALLFLVAMLSLSVGILNLFPLAPLDGGHLAILATEGVLRRDFSMAVKAWIMNAGAMVLFLLIGLVLYSDLSKSFLGRYLP